MSNRKLLSVRRSSRTGRRLSSEQLESRQLLAADFGMFGAPNLSLMQFGSRFNVGALVSQMQQRSSGEISASLDSLRERLSSNPAAREFIQQRLQGSENGQAILNRVTEKARELGVDVKLESAAPSFVGTEAATAVESSPQTKEPVAVSVEVALPPESATVEQPRRAVVRDRIMDRLDGELSEFAVVTEDGTIDREATRENIRAKVADGEVADKLRERIKDRFDGELPAFVVLAEDGIVDREATRANIRAKVADGEVADKLRERIKDRLDGELPEFVVLAEDGTVDRAATRENIRAKVTLPDSGPAPTPLAAPSPIGRYDVNRDGAISPLDALRVINALNGRAVAEVTTYDVNQDGAVTPLDALLVINRLNDRVVPQVASTDAIDAFFAEDDEDEDETLIFLLA